MSECEEKVRAIIEQLQEHNDESGLVALVKGKLLVDEELAALRMEVELKQKVKQAIEERDVQGVNKSSNWQTTEGMLQVLERNLEQRSQIHELKAKLLVAKAQVNTLSSSNRQAGSNGAMNKIEQNVTELQRSQEERVDALKEIIARRDTTLEAYSRRVKVLEGRKDSEIVPEGSGNSSKLEEHEKTIQDLRVQVLSSREREAHLGDLNKKLREDLEESQTHVKELKLSIGRARASLQSTELINDVQSRYRQLEIENENLIAQMNDVNSKQVMLLTQNTHRVREEEKIKLIEAEERYRRQLAALNATNSVNQDELRILLEKEKEDLRQEIKAQEREVARLQGRIKDTQGESVLKLKEQKTQFDKEIEQRLEEARNAMELERKERQKEGYIVMEENKKFREQIRVKSLEDARIEVRQEIERYQHVIRELEEKFMSSTEKLQEQHQNQIANLISEQHRQLEELSVVHQQAVLALTESVYRLEQERAKMARKIAVFELNDLNARAKMLEEAESREGGGGGGVGEGNEMDKMKLKIDVLMATVAEMNAKAEEASVKHLKEVSELCEEVIGVKGKVQEWYQEQLDFATKQQAEYVKKMRGEMEKAHETNKTIVKRLKDEINDIYVIMEERPSKKSDLAKIADLESKLSIAKAEIIRLQREHTNAMKNFDVFNPFSSGQSSGGATGKAGRTIHSIATNFTPSNQQKQSKNITPSSNNGGTSGGGGDKDNKDAMKSLDIEQQQQQQQQQSQQQLTRSFSGGGAAGGFFKKNSRKSLSKQRCKTMLDDSVMTNATATAAIASATTMSGFPDKSYVSPARRIKSSERYSYGKSQLSVDADLEDLLDPSGILKNSYLKRVFKMKQNNQSKWQSPFHLDSTPGKRTPAKPTDRYSSAYLNIKQAAQQQYVVLRSKEDSIVLHAQKPQRPGSTKAFNNE